MSRPLFSSLLLALFASIATTAFAGEEKIVIEMKSDDVQIVDVDASHMAPGDAETIVTDSGKRVDILKTQDGVEVYIDGELVDSGLHGDHGDMEKHHFVHKEVKIICDEGQDCADIDVDVEHEFSDADAHGEKIIVIKKEVKIN